MVRKDKKNGNNKEKAIQPVRMSGKEVEKRLLEAESEEDLNTIHNVLKLEGVPDGSIRAIISRLKSKGLLIFQTAVTEYAPGTKPLAVEAIIHEMKLPTIIMDGGKEIFDAGVTYGMRALVAGVRLAQELSQMGISQASPVIRMAQELRAGAGESAREAGEVAAENAVAGAIGFMSEQKPGKVDIATVQNPLMGVMARAMEPALTQALGKMFGSFVGGQPQPSGQGQPSTQPVSNLPPGWSEKKQDEE